MMRKPARAKAPIRQDYLGATSLPAPYKGWNARDPEALMQDAYALSMVNCFPSTADIELRRGATTFTTGLASAVKGLLSYHPATGSPKLFASIDAGLFLATSGAVGSVASIHSNGYVRGVNFRTTGNSWLIVYNGTESLRRYNGTTWTTDVSYPIVGGGTLLTADIVNAAVFKHRLFFAESGTLDAYALALDSVTGDVDPIPLGALFDLGGSLVAIGTWTLDGGKGEDDRIVFITSKGQAAVYAGSDPTDASNWNLVGVYNLAEPIGFDCLLKYGGDLLYLSKTGLYPMSAALQTTTITPAISDVIRDEFVKAAQLYGSNKGWCIAIDQPNSLLIVNIPITTLGYSKQFVMNLVTKAWCSFQDWHAYCFRYHNGQLYMGRSTTVDKAYSGLSDFGSVITGTCKQAFSYFGMPGVNKHVSMLRPVLKLMGAASVEVALDGDFHNDAQFGPTNFITGAGAVWQVSGDPVTAEWDTATWADDSGIRLNWLTVAAYPAYAFALRLRFSSSSAKVAWTATDLLLEKAGHL